MTRLPTDHPEVYNFMAGYFSVQLAGESPFGRIPVNQTTKVTVNKDTKTTGSTTKFSFKTGAVTRFYMTAEYRCSYLGQLRDMIQVKRPLNHHDELQAPRKSRDEKAVNAVQTLIQSWNNPFLETQELISISTAKKAPVDVLQDLMQAYEIGENAYQQFKKTRKQATNKEVSRYDEVKKLTTFSSLSKKKTISTKNRSIILRADRSMFGRMIVKGKSRKIEVKELLRHSLSPLHWALATPKGFPKTQQGSPCNLSSEKYPFSDRNNSTEYSNCHRWDEPCPKAKCWKQSNNIWKHRNCYSVHGSS